MINIKKLEKIKRKRGKVNNLLSNKIYILYSFNSIKYISENIMKK